MLEANSRRSERHSNMVRILQFRRSRISVSSGSFCLRLGKVPIQTASSTGRMPLPKPGLKPFGNVLHSVKCNSNFRGNKVSRI